jgi:hypothetical protein
MHITQSPRQSKALAFQGKASQQSPHPRQPVRFGIGPVPIPHGSPHNASDSEAGKIIMGTVGGIIAVLLASAIIHNSKHTIAKAATAMKNSLLRRPKPQPNAELGMQLPNLNIDELADPRFVRSNAPSPSSRSRSSSLSKNSSPTEPEPAHSQARQPQGDLEAGIPLTSREARNNFSI